MWSSVDFMGSEEGWCSVIVSISIFNVCLMSHGWTCVCQLSKCLSVPPPPFSQQLRVHREDGDTAVFFSHETFTNNEGQTVECSEVVEDTASDVHNQWVSFFFQLKQCGRCTEQSANVCILAAVTSIRYWFSYSIRCPGHLWTLISLQRVK